jgi:Na+-driven multidrug efflux pump
MQLFTNDDQVVAIGTDYIQIAAFFTPVIAVLNISIALMQGLKKPGYTVFISIFKEVIASIIIIYLLSFYFNFQLNGIWSSVLIINYLSVIVFLIILNYRVKSIGLKIFK